MSARRACAACSASCGPISRQQLDALREKSRTLAPFAFYADLLGAQNGRQRLLARLGHEANDALDEFLNLALDYERIETPSLQGFVAWLRTAQAEVKRDMEMARDEVRVMTVHGAKGLEAPIVILADTTTPPQGFHPPRLLQLPQKAGPPPLIWATAKANDVGPMEAARNVALGEARDEYRRLLYVAMTRAIERLIVCGVDGIRERPEGCWYDLTRDALETHCVSEPADDGDGAVLRFRKVAAAPQAKPVKAPALELALLPPWLTQKITEGPASVPIQPSGFIDDREAQGLLGQREARRRAILRGNILHRLMQSLPDLPPAARVEAARQHIVRQSTNFSETDQNALVAAALALLNDAALRQAVPARQPRRGFDRRPPPGARRLRPDRPADGDAGRSADRRLQDQPAGAEQPRRDEEAPCRLRKAARALSRGADAALSRPAGPGCAAVDRYARFDGDSGGRTRRRHRAILTSA